MRYIRDTFTTLKNVLLKHDNIQQNTYLVSIEIEGLVSTLHQIDFRKVQFRISMAVGPSVLTPQMTHPEIKYTTTLELIRNTTQIWSL